MSAFGRKQISFKFNTITIFLKSDDRTKACDLCAGKTDAGAARMPDIGVHRLEGPARYNLGSISKLEIGFIVARRRGKGPEIDLILIEGTNTGGKTSVDDGRAEAVVWPIRHHAFENNPTIKI